MHLENVVIDALDPQVLGGFWETALGSERLTDEADIVETRLAYDGGFFLDLCFQQVPEPVTVAPRLHLVVAEAPGPSVDPEGNAFRARAGAGPLVAIELDSADPDRDVAFWSWLTGWTEVDPHTLAHPDRVGPLVVLVPEQGPKTATKNRMHLDVRLGPGEDADEVEAAILERGGRRLAPEWGELPWRTYLDPSGNELCVLPAPRSSTET
ncbi:VOC family protein [Nocardioides mangrovi]|uniref:VOC family protein n=1 Tax=Nocardioides mangrovi TaxID=2874580 RepID=A0ABS7UE76_9ACTN|nr:VOC family protein [Nocardioides mangrovi]MBZ5739301.1 VOC family protein [Nocardioides mangrovi]